MPENGTPPGLPGGPPAPQRQQQPQPMREEYPTFGISVGETENGRVLVIECPLPRKTMIFPFERDMAEKVGRKLAAPSVVVPGMG